MSNTAYIEVRKSINLNKNLEKDDDSCNYQFVIYDTYDHFSSYLIEKSEMEAMIEKYGNDVKGLLKKFIDEYSDSHSYTELFQSILDKGQVSFFNEFVEF
jgi:hypothetical protein